jgi:hypothetical protein
VNLQTLKHSNYQTFISPRWGLVVANGGLCYNHLAPPERAGLDARFDCAFNIAYSATINAVFPLAH